MTHVDWPAVIKQYRKTAYMTQKQLAEELGVDATTVSRWERGIHPPDVKTARLLRHTIKNKSVFTEDHLRAFLLMPGNNTLIGTDLTSLGVSEELVKLTKGVAADGVGKHFYRSAPFRKHISLGFAFNLALRDKSVQKVETIELNEIRHKETPFSMIGKSSYIPVRCDDGSIYILSTSVQIPISSAKDDMTAIVTTLEGTETVRL